MRFLYGCIVFSTLIGLASTAIAASSYTTLVGKWNYRGRDCTPCTLQIEQVKDDGEIVARYFARKSWVTGWGRASIERERLWVRITLENGSKLNLRLSKKGGELKGFFETYSGSREDVVSFKLVKN